MASGAVTRTESDRFERWLELIPFCNRAEEGIELDELAGLFDDSAETILADVQALVDREYYLPGSFADSLTILIDGERLDLTSPDHFQRPISFSAMEALAVQLGLQMEADAGEERAEESDVARLLTDVLESASSSSLDQGDTTHACLFAYGGELTTVRAEILERLSMALRERRMVELLYYKPYEPEEPRPRSVVPWALANVIGTWYLLAEDNDLGEPRVFRLDRIIDVAVSETRAEVPKLRVEDFIDPTFIYRESEDDLTVRICYSPRIAPWIVERYDGDVTAEDGSVVVVHRYKNPWWAINRALGHGVEARVTDCQIAGMLEKSLTSILEPH